MFTYIKVKMFTCLSSVNKVEVNLLHFGMPTLSFCLISEYNMVQKKGVVLTVVIVSM